MVRLNSIFNRESYGFTIIEVLIVLAIAGLIMLTIFIAVPAANRNERNLKRKHDVGLILSAVNEFEVANNGTPPLWAHTDTTTTNQIFIGDATANPVYVTLAYYNPWPFSSLGVPFYAPMTPYAPSDNGLNVTTTEDMKMIVGAVCDTTQSVLAPGGAHDVAIVYTLEPNVKRCEAT